MAAKGHNHGKKWLKETLNFTKMKTLLCTLAFIGSYFGIFIIMTTIVALIFPISWNELVTHPAWLVPIMILGLMPATFIVDEVSTELNRKNKTF